MTIPRTPDSGGTASIRHVLRSNWNSTRRCPADQRVDGLRASAFLYLAGAADGTQSDAANAWVVELLRAAEEEIAKLTGAEGGESE